MTDYKVEFKMSSLPGFDKDLSKDYLDVYASVTKQNIRHYYNFVDAELLRNMPQNILEDLKCKIDEVIKQRESLK